MYIKLHNVSDKHILIVPGRYVKITLSYFVKLILLIVCVRIIISNHFNKPEEENTTSCKQLMYIKIYDTSDKNILNGSMKLWEKKYKGEQNAANCRIRLASKNYTNTCKIKMLEMEHPQTNFKVKVCKISKRQLFKKF